MIIVATTSLPAVDCWNADRWNAAHLCQKVATYVIASRLFERQPTGTALMPKLDSTTPMTWGEGPFHNSSIKIK